MIILFTNMIQPSIYTYTLCTYCYFLFLPPLARQKPRTAFPEEREDDKDLSMDYGDYPCLNWKEILSIIYDYYKVNSFLIGHDTLFFKNVILPKLLYLMYH